MDKNERNEHFKGFADLVAQEIEQLEERVVPGTDLPISQGHWQEAIRDIIAQRAYDLVDHALKSIEDYEHEMCYESDLLPEARFDHVPDLTEWPTSQ